MAGQKKFTTRQAPNSLPTLREQCGSSNITGLIVSAGVRKDVSDETVRRVLRGAGKRVY